MTGLKPNRALVMSGLLLAIAMCAGPAMAGIVYYENPPPGEQGHFNWHFQGADNPETFENWLDITKPSTDQFELRNGSSVGQLEEENGDVNFTFGGADVAIVVGTTRTRAFAFGENIGDATFDSRGWHAFLSGETGQWESDFPNGELRYIGVLTQSGNYGWVGVIRRVFTIETTGWAYETEPGVLILAGAVPTGATAAPLLMLPFFRRSRSRKRW